MRPYTDEVALAKIPLETLHGMLHGMFQDSEEDEDEEISVFLE